jgi:SAM-dependent methyltransferase
MPTSEEHYRNLLAVHYSWMFGLSFDEKVAEQRALIEPLLIAQPRGQAVDLGSGPGFQSFALADLGFGPIYAIDTSHELLAELEAHRQQSPECPIHTRAADMLTLNRIVGPASVAAAVCMGDTLTHLPTLEDVRHLCSAVATALIPGGVFILTWRDLTTELTGKDRFIPVHSTADKHMTCFLEYTSPTRVQVYDLIYAADPGGHSWTLAKGSYPKLRLSPAQLAGELTALGLIVDPPAAAGRLSLAVAHKASV